MTVHLKPVDRRVVELKDPSLLVGQAYVAGEWVDALTARPLPSPIRMTARSFSRCPTSALRPPAAPSTRRMRCRRTGPSAPPRSAARSSKCGRPDHRQCRRSGAHPHRAGQAAGRGQGRGDLERGLYRVVRGGGQAHRRRRHSRRQPRPAHRGAEAAGGRVRRHHPLELSQRHDHPQGRPGADAGRTMCIKPAAQTPLSALALAVLAERAGVPKGAFSVITTEAKPARSSATTRRWPRSPSPARPGSVAG